MEWSQDQNDQKLGVGPGWANARPPGHAKFANVGTDKVGKCSAVARGRGQGAFGFD